MLALAALLFVAAPPSSQDAAAAAFMRETYALTEYASARHDLDGDGADEILIRATNRDRCGSGGCALFVLSPKGDGFTVVMEATVEGPGGHRVGRRRPAPLRGAAALRWAALSR